MNPWYLTRVIPKIFPAWTLNFTDAKKAFTSMLVDVFVAAWPRLTAVIFVTGMYTTGGDLRASVDKVRTQFMPAYLAGLKFFPVTKLVLYGFVPILFRGIAGNLVTTIWSVIFSWVVHNY